MTGTKPTVTSNEKGCAVAGCDNSSVDGRFVGDFCAPCDSTIRTGTVGHGHSFIHRDYAGMLEFQAKFIAADQELRALRTSHETCEWRPIETAPKDGTKILLGYFPEPVYEGASTGESWEVAFWHGIHQKWCGRVLLNAEGSFSPTHWMLVPAPPAQKAAPGEKFEPYAGDSLQRLIADMRVAADATRDKRSVYPWITQWIERLEGGLTKGAETLPVDGCILPCDVKVGNTTIKAGLPVNTVLKSIRVHAQARPAFSSPTQKANSCVHIWSVKGPPRDPEPHQFCDNGCGLMWKDRTTVSEGDQRS